MRNASCLYMKNVKFKSSLLTTTLISASLFGSKPNPGKLQLTQEATQEIAQSIRTKDLFPFWARNTMSFFNNLPEVKTLKAKYDLRKKESDDPRIRFGKALVSKRHTNDRVIIRGTFNVKDTFDLRNEYEELFLKKFHSALKSVELEKASQILFDFVVPYVRCSFYELIGYPVDSELLSILQKSSMRALIQEDSEQYFDDWEFSFWECYCNVSNNPIIKMLQECILDLLEAYKNCTGNTYLYLLAKKEHAFNNSRVKKIEGDEHGAKYEELKKEVEKGSKELVEISQKFEHVLMFCFLHYKCLSIRLIDIDNIILDYVTIEKEDFQGFLKKLNASFEHYESVIKDIKDVASECELFDIYKCYSKVLGEFYEKFKTGINEQLSTRKVWQKFSETAKELLEMCKSYSEEVKEFEDWIVGIETRLDKKLCILKQNTSIAIAFSKLKEDLNKYKEMKNQDRLARIAFSESIKSFDECKRLTSEIEAIKKEKETSKPQPKPVAKKKQKQPKQASLHGRKAARATQAIPTHTSQKQMKQAPKPKTLENLDAKFGEDLEKAFDELELITIDFVSEEDWNEFQKESNVEFGSSYRHGSHESQEITFNFEGQKTKGQLLTHHVHGKDTPEEISRQVRVTRRAQK